MVDDEFICHFVQPFGKCNLPEMLVVGLLLYLNGLLSLFFFGLHLRHSHKTDSAIFDQTGLFWITLALWQLYRGTCQIFFFPWGVLTYRLLYVCASQNLMIIANGFAILLLFKLLFTYRNPGTEAVKIFQLLLTISLLTFVCISIILSIIGLDEGSDDADRPTSLWSSMTMLVCALFFILPARALIRVVTFSGVQKEDRPCVNICHILMWLYTLLYFGRSIWNLTHYFGINKLQDLIYEHSWHAPGVRTFDSVYIAIFDVLPASIAIAGAYILRKHDMLFNETAYFATHRS
jgi:hypothetical protein